MGTATYVPKYSNARLDTRVLKHSSVIPWLSQQRNATFRGNTITSIRVRQRFL